MLNLAGECFTLRFEKHDSLLAAGYSNGYIVTYNTESMNFQKYMTNSDFPITCIR